MGFTVPLAVLIAGSTIAGTGDTRLFDIRINLDSANLTNMSAGCGADSDFCLQPGTILQAVDEGGRMLPYQSLVLCTTANFKLLPNKSEAVSPEVMAYCRNPALPAPDKGNTAHSWAIAWADADPAFCDEFKKQVEGRLSISIVRSGRRDVFVGASLDHEICLREFAIALEDMEVVGLEKSLPALIEAHACLPYRALAENGYQQCRVSCDARVQTYVGRMPTKN